MPIFSHRRACLFIECSWHSCVDRLKGKILVQNIMKWIQCRNVSENSTSQMNHSLSQKERDHLYNPAVKITLNKQEHANTIADYAVLPGTHAWFWCVWCTVYNEVFLPTATHLPFHTMSETFTMHGQILAGHKWLKIVIEVLKELKIIIVQ